MFKYFLEPTTFTASFVSSDSKCNPSPCGVNTDCTVKSGRPICSCPDGFDGNPFTACFRKTASK